MTDMFTGFKVPEDARVMSLVFRVAPHLSGMDSDAIGRSADYANKSDFDSIVTAVSPGQTAFRILDWGAGFGRSTVLFSRMWPNAEVVALDGSGSSPRYPVCGPRESGSFYGDPEALREVLEFNGCGAAVVDAESVELESLGPFGLIFSLYAIGFHWEASWFMKELNSISRLGTVFFFHSALGHRQDPFPGWDGHIVPCEPGVEMNVWVRTRA